MHKNNKFSTTCNCLYYSASDASTFSSKDFGHGIEIGSMLLGILATHEINLQAHEYHCIFHLRVFQVSNPRERVCTDFVQSVQGHTQIRGKDREDS
jgi:hypothetical protein